MCRSYASAGARNTALILPLAGVVAARVAGDVPVEGRGADLEADLAEGHGELVGWPVVAHARAVLERGDDDVLEAVRAREDAAGERQGRRGGVLAGERRPSEGDGRRVGLLDHVQVLDAHLAGARAAPAVGGAGVGRAPAVARDGARRS